MRLRARNVLVILRRVALVLVALELAYLAVANFVLRTQWIQQAVSDADGFHLELGSAYSLWPGRVHVEDFRLRVEDYNVQFEVKLGQANLDIALSELLRKRFHVTRLDATGTRFRMRHKLIVVGDDAERVAAYPPIAGFADPPYYVGVRPPPVSDADYDLWEVRIENVTARADELWVMEYRFTGEATARGSFVVRPARWVQVLPAELVLERGTLRLGEHRAAEQVRGRVSCEVPDMQVQATDGVQVFREISSRVELRLTGGELTFLQAYLARRGSARYAGQGDWHIDVRLQKGVLQPGTRMALLAAPLVIRHDFATVSGDAMVSLTGPSRAAPNTLNLSVNAPSLQASRRRSTSATPPSLRGLRGQLALHGADLTGELRVGAGQLTVQDLRVPELAWLDSAATKLGGKLSAQLELRRDQAGLLSGRAGLSASDARVSRGTFAASGQLQAELALAPSEPEDLELSKLDLEASQLALRSGDKRSHPVAARITGSGWRVAARGSPAARGPLRLRLSSTEALLPLFVDSALREVSSAALDLKALNGRADLELTPERLKLTRIEAESGRLKLRGHVEQRAEPSGALLLSSGPLNVGVTLRDGDAELSPFVADDWLGPPRI
jgi:hypothetical protein